MGHSEQGIMKGACALAFNDMRSPEEMRKVADEFDLTVNEDLEKKFQDWKQRDEDWARLKKGPMGTVLTDEEDEETT